MKMLHRVRLFATLAACVLCVGRPLSAAPRGVEILWDKYGIGHVYAQNLEGLFFGYGYVQMQSHGNLILKLYGESRGRAAEYWGEKSDAGATANLENDRWVRLNEAPERADRWLAQQTPEYQRCFAAFADGMNAYAERHPDALEASRKKVLPIRPVDSLLHVHRIVHFGYLSSMRGVEAAVKPGPAPSGGESNAWAIAPARSASGKTLLLMNPHLPWSDWSIYYEAHLVAPGINLYGSSQVGFPMLRFVFSDVLGFTQTVNSIDASDLYKLTLSTDGEGYVFDGQVKPFEKSTQVIRILQPDGTLREEPLVVRKSVHGPVVWNQDGVTIAIRTAGLDRPFMIEQYWKMALARSFAEYEAQLKRLQVPTFNITYADRDGHIMYLYNGTLPKRASGDADYWAGVVPGDTSATLWTEIHPYADLPKLIDPPSGWVQNTNNPPWIGTFPGVLDPAAYPPSIGGTTLAFRTMTSLRMLHDDPSVTFDELLAYKHSTHLELADRIVDDLVAAAGAQGTERAKAAASVLKAWDRRADSGSRGALLFEAFAMKFMGPALADRKGFATRSDWKQPFTTPRGLKDPTAAVAQLDAAADETIKRYGALDAPWGEFRRFQIGATDLPANGADGNLGAFRVMRYVPIAKGSPKQKAVFGDTIVLAVEFTNPVHAMALTSYGNSSQPGSPHSADQLSLLNQQKLRPAFISRADVEANLESRDQF